MLSESRPASQLLNGRSSILGAMLWMAGLSFLLTLLLWWVPVVGPFIGPVAGGYVGGRRAGSAGAALLASVLPSILLAGILMLFVTTIGAAMVGPIAALIGGAVGLVTLVIAITHGGLMIVAALVGGFMREADPAG